MRRKRFGHFDPENREYVIADPRTPMPWMNYLFNDEYYALISATAGGYSFLQNARDRRILRYRLNNLPMDRPGRYIYVRDQDSGKYWSATWAPVQADPEAEQFECRHGFGYTRIRHVYRNVQSVVTYVVPLDDPLEIWHVRIRNLSGRPRSLQVFPYAEFCVWNALNDLSNFQFTYNIVKCRRTGNVIHHETWTRRHGLYAFFAASRKPARWDCDREAFIGRCRSEANPIAVAEGRCRNTSCFLGNPIAAFQTPLGLDAGEEKEIVFLLGAPPKRSYAMSLAKKYFAPGAVDAVLDNLRNHWQRVLGEQVVATPDRDVNLCLNQWHAYQTHVTFRVSRGPSIYEGGIGRGMGFRDSCQDTLGVAHAERRRVRDLLCALAQNQFREGNSRHQFFRLSGQGEGGGSFDTHLWLVYAVANYLKESGDLAFLDEPVAFADRGSASIRDHLKSAVRFSLKHCGAHGIPLLGFSDWNDCLQCPGPNHAAESVFTGMMTVAALREMQGIAAQCGKRAEAERRRTQADKLARRLHSACWDGKWYLRAFDDQGRKLGSANNRQAKIFLNSQTWSVLSGVADAEHGQTAMDSVRKHLDSAYGVAKLWPAYRRFDPTIGALSDINSGSKENGGIFSHTNSWVVIAEALLGRGDRAYEYYKKLLPTVYDKMQERHEAEPYVYAQAICGPEHPAFGVARNSWLTGAVAWMYVAATQYILGLRPWYTGLCIDPCIPPAWKGYQVKRKFRSGYCQVRVENPDHVSCGVKELWVDGEAHAGNLAPPPAPGKTVEVRVVLGKHGTRARQAGVCAFVPIEEASADARKR